jgi:hypothetical protein
MTSERDVARALALVEKLFGPSDERADRVVEVLNAQAAALSWVYETTGAYPAPPEVAKQLHDVAMTLREDDRDPVPVLRQVAADALAARGYAAA